MSKLNIQESNNNYYPIVYNLYDSVYECKNFEYAKYKNKKCILEKQLAYITQEIKESYNNRSINHILKVEKEHRIERILKSDGIDKSNLLSYKCR